jgi:hypothetical protein
MDEAMDGQSVDSWLKRAHAEGTSSTSARTVPETAAPAIGDRLRDSWDPWEVWLRLVHQPRQRQAALRVKSLDSAP